MAHHVEPMDVDCMGSDFDNKENTFNHNNMLPCTEKGYEELDVSELNMKLRYSMTPASSPMSKSYTSSLDNRHFETDDLLNCNNENSNLTRSLNSTITKNESVVKSLKNMPLQSISTAPFTDSNGNSSALRQLNSTIADNTNLRITISGTNDNDENLSLPSSSSSALHTPEATTPTKEIPKDGGSPIMRGLKSVLNMFRSSQSPIPPNEGDNNTMKQEALSPSDVFMSQNDKPQAVASTPIAAHRTRDGNASKRSSPYKDSIVFNDDLEKELNWKDETTILFSDEKIPISKLFFQQAKGTLATKPAGIVGQNSIAQDFNLNVEYMDISFNESKTKDITRPESLMNSTKQEISFTAESDSEFLDCETTFTKNESQVLQHTKDSEGNEISLTTNTQNIDVADNISSAVDLNPVPVSADVTETAIPDGELKNNITQPSDYSDFSKETTQILLDLESFEKNVTPIPEPFATNISLQENVTKEENYIKQSEIQGMPTGIALEKDKQDNKNVTTKSDDDLCEMTQDLNVLVTEHIETKISVSPETAIKSTEIAETFFKNTESDEVAVENILDQINMSVVCDASVHLSSQILQEHQENFNTIIVPVIKEMESASVAHAVCSENVTVIMPSEISNLEQNNMIAETSKVVRVEQPSMSLCLTNEECQITSEKFEEEQNVSVLEIINTSPSKKPSEIPLPDEDDADNEVNSQIPTVLSPESAIAAFPEFVNVTNTLPEFGIPETIQKDIVEQVKSNEMSTSRAETPAASISETLNATNALPDLNTSETNTKDLEVNKDVKPSDVIATSSDTETMLETSNVTNNLPQMETNETVYKNLDIDIEVQISNVSTNLPSDMVLATETIHKDLSDPLFMDKIEFNSIESINATSYENVQEPVVLETNENKLETSETSHEKPLNDVPEIVKNTTINESISNTPLELHSNMSLESQELMHTNSKQDVTETIYQTYTEISPESKIGNNILPPEQTSHTATLDQTYDAIVNEITENVDHLQSELNTLNVTVAMENFKQETLNQSNISKKPTNNENLNKTHDLPDLINQSVVINEAGMQNLTQTITNTIDMPKQDNLPDINTNLEPPLESFTPETKDNESDHSVKSDSASLKTDTVPKNESNISQNDVVVNLLSTDDKISGNVTENVQDNNVSRDTDAEIHHEISTENSSEIRHEEQKIIGGQSVDEEILDSENNSPYVSLMADAETISEKADETFEKIENTFIANTNLASSPPITSRGYNFNFDEMDDPFATKAKVRLSPPPDTPIKLVEKGAIRRQCQPPEKKKPNVTKKKFNSTFDARGASKMSAKKKETGIRNVQDKTTLNTDVNCETQDTKKAKETTIKAIAKSFDATQKIHDEDLNESTKNDWCEMSLETNKDKKSSLESINTASSDFKTTSSSEQSTYYSAGASSTDSVKSKNVFNLPEIDDVNFNPFATKSKMRQSPPPGVEILNPFATRTKMVTSPEASVYIPSHLDSTCTISEHEAKSVQLVEKVSSGEKMETEKMEKENSANTTNNTTSTSKSTDNQNLTHEINTEDEDTIEGPFLDPDDDIDKITFEADNEDMIQFNRSPVHRTENNMEDGELFIDAEAFECLLNQRQSNVVIDSGKESLFLKFDPLFAKRVSSDGVLAALNQVQKRQSTPTKPTRPSLRNEASPIAGPSTMNVTYEGDDNIFQESSEDVNVTISKPMMVVTPAVNPAVTPRNKSITPNRSNRRSITFTSPAIAVIDRLLSMSANNSLVGQDTAMTHANRDHTEADLALTQLRELLAEKEISVYNLRSESKELKDRLAAMESQVRILEEVGQDRLKKINELNERLAEKTKINKSMAAVVEEYERTIASLIAETEQDKKRHAEERLRLINERDEQTAHLASMEVSFSDLHSKYEKSKQIIIACKANEDTYKKSLKNLEENVTKLQANYETLKQHATSKLNHANQELERINRAHEADVLKLNAKLKRQELHVTSLEESLAQKMRANEELTAICDELINKVG